MANLYDIKCEFLTLWNLIEDETVDDEILAEAFTEATEDLAYKLENCCKYIKNCESDIAGLKEEEKRLSAKRKSLENGIERLKVLMKSAMEVAGEKKIPCGTFTCSRQANPPRVILDEPYIENIPEEYLVAQDPTINKKQMLEDMKNGKDLSGLAHLEYGESIRIR